MVSIHLLKSDPHLRVDALLSESRPENTADDECMALILVDDSHKHFPAFPIKRKAHFVVCVQVLKKTLDDRRDAKLIAWHH